MVLLVATLCKSELVRADYPTFETWYKKTHKKVYPVTVTGNPAEDVEIQTEVEKVSEESKVHDPVRYLTSIT